MDSAVPFLIEATLRDLRRAGWAGVGALLLILVTAVTAGGYRVLSENLGRIVTAWRGQARVVLYLGEEPSRREEWLAGLRALGVREWRLISPDEALGELETYFGPQGELLARLPSNPLPVSVEVTPDPALSAAGLRELIRALEGLPGVEEIRGPGRWVEWTEAGRRVFTGLGLGLAGMLALAALVAVMTATTAAVEAGREEAALARLVGATERTVRLPLLLGGAIQGALGSLAAVGLLVLAERQLLLGFGSTLREVTGLQAPAFLGWGDALWLVAGGVALGALGGLVRGRGR